MISAKTPRKTVKPKVKKLAIAEPTKEATQETILQLEVIPQEPVVSPNRPEINS